MGTVEPKVWGYCRVSTQEQSLDSQKDALIKYGVSEKNIFEEKITGTKKDRPELNKLLGEHTLRPGDTVVVYKLDRISRSTKHLIELSEEFNKRGVNFVSIQDQLDTTTAYGKFFFRMMASMAELERDIISERTKAGLESARARGRQGGRPSKKKEKIELAFKMYDSNQYSIDEILDATGFSKTTLYRYLNNR
jgi:DNA invertase Pin-like site-specific DNA recombinase